jgi:NHL repeat
VVDDELRACRPGVLLMRAPQRVALLSGFVSLCLVSCGGSTVTPALSHASNQSSWQVILTVKTAGVNFGIPGIALDCHGNIYVAELDDDLIYEYSISGKLESQWGGPGSGPGQLGRPDKLAFDGQGNLYVTEVSPISYGTEGGNSRVQKFSPTGTPLAQWGKFGSAPGQFNNPIGIAVDQQGAIYVAEEGGDRIQKLSPLGKPLLHWGTLGSRPGQFNLPYDLALDSSGNVYVSEPAPLSPGTIAFRSSPRPEYHLHSGGGRGPAPGSSTIQPDSRLTAKATFSWSTPATTALRNSRQTVDTSLNGVVLVSNSSARLRWMITGPCTCQSVAKS